MLEKEPSGAPPAPIQPPQIAGATPGGPFPQGKPPVDADQNRTDPPHQYTLQFLIEAIKKLSSKSVSTNTEKAQ